MKNLANISIGMLFSGGYLSIETAQSLSKARLANQAKLNSAQRESRIQCLGTQPKLCC